MDTDPNTELAAILNRMQDIPFIPSSQGATHRDAILLLIETIEALCKQHEDVDSVALAHDIVAAYGLIPRQQPGSAW